VVSSTGKACGKEMKTKFDFALNLRTVKALGIMFPSGVVGSFVAVHESTAAL
jgi:hypothetical protein